MVMGLICLCIIGIGAPTGMMGFFLSHKRKMRELELEHQREMTKALDAVIR